MGGNQPGRLRPGEGEKSQVSDEEEDGDPRCDRRSTVPALRGRGEIRRRGAAGISGRRRLVRAWSAGASGGVSKHTCIPSSPFEKQHKASGCRFVPETEIRNPLEVTSKLDRTAVQSHPRQNPPAVLREKRCAIDARKGRRARRRRVCVRARANVCVHVRWHL